MIDPELKKGLDLAEWTLQAIFPHCEVTFAESFTNLGWNFYVEHGVGPLETITILLPYELLHDEDGQEILEHRLRGSDLPRFAARCPHGTIEIGMTEPRVLDGGES